jgi:putative peptide zinc metalloprotease protein
VVGPLPGPPPQDRAEAEALFADTPALSGLAVDQRLALIASAHPVDLDPGAPVILPGPTHAIVVESGVIAMPDGIELRRGTLVGPVGDGSPGAVAQTRTPVRLWVIPDASDLPPLVGATHRPGSPMPVVAVNGGLRPGAPAPDAYPPLAVPPGPPEGPEGVATDRRFEGRLWWLVVLLLVVALVLTGLSFRPGPAWAEMPADNVLVTVDHGRADASIGGKLVPLEPGDRRYVGTGTRVEVPAQAAARLTFPGGAVVMMCAGSRLEVRDVATASGRTQAPKGTLSLETGRLLASTGSTSGAYEALVLTVSRNGGNVVNSGAAWYAADPGAVTVSTGKVSVGGTVSAAAGGDLTCGDGVPVTPPDQGPTEEPLPSDSVSVPPDVLPSVPPSSAVPTTEPAETENPATTEPTEEPTTTRPTTRPTTTRPTTRPTTQPTTEEPPTTPPTTTPTPTDTTSVTASAETSPATVDDSPSSEDASPSAVESSTLV